ncbi:hypothetical protein NLI96_g13076 [Meripilus lineatus]|uniref:Tf2-1-like SH3-like domain-containing protein n=1 Tax=Meripilus lineatus TaxID=2056292 RepID=A0AAD5Y9A0_9APHY|nr:hypothetical protein NLI96_g13076 [Physisporinus lineatus]
MSTAFHPQTDGASERVIHSVTQILRWMTKANQSDWVEKLPMVEFTMNSTQGGHDRPLLEAGGSAYLLTKNLNLPKGRAHKLLPKFLGPYKILEGSPESSNYVLELLDELKTRGIHPQFHVSRLEPFIANDNRLFPRRDPKVFYDYGMPDDTEWSVDDIVGHQWNKNKLQFHVKWNMGETTWKPRKHCEDLKVLDNYLQLMGTPNKSITQAMDNRHSNSEGNLNKRRRTRGYHNPPPPGAKGKHWTTALQAGTWIQSADGFRVYDNWTQHPSVVPRPYHGHGTLPLNKWIHYRGPTIATIEHIDADSELVSFQAVIAKRENHFNTRVEVARQNEASATAEIDILQQVVLTLQAELKEIERERNIGRERNLLLQQQVKILERDPSAMVVDPRDPPPTNQHTYDLDDHAQDLLHLRDDISSDDPLYEVFASDWEETEEDHQEAAQKAARNAARAQLRTERRAMETPEKQEYRFETRRVL